MQLPPLSVDIISSHIILLSTLYSTIFLTRFLSTITVFIPEFHMQKQDMKHICCDKEETTGYMYALNYPDLQPWQGPPWHLLQSEFQQHSNVPSVRP